MVCKIFGIFFGIVGFVVSYLSMWWYNRGPSLYILSALTGIIFGFLMYGFIKVLTYIFIPALVFSGLMVIGFLIWYLFDWAVFEIMYLWSRRMDKGGE